MMQMDQNSWPTYNTIDLPLEEVELYFADMDAQAGSFEFPSPSISIFSGDSSSMLFSSTIQVDDTYNFPFPVSDDDLPALLPIEQFLTSLDEVQTNSSDQFMVDGTENLCELMPNFSNLYPEQISSEENGGSPSFSSISDEFYMDVQSAKTSLILPNEDMEVDEDLSTLHLLKAYGEAMESAQKELADEIIRRLKEKACPTGTALKRLAYYLTLSLDKQADYLKQELSKNYEAAFKAFYQIFPYGRFAHFAANSAILESIPQDASVVHIVDFHIGNGIQWAPLIEALGRKGQKMLRLTSIKWEEEDDSCSPITQMFEETKKQLCELALNFGLRLKVEEMDMEELVIEMKKGRKRGGRSEWLAFNCMVGLPHMGKRKSIGNVTEFLKVAKESINNPNDICNNSNNRGIVAFGNGGVVENWINCSGFGSFFERQLIHFQAIVESMEQHFPAHLREARIAMEYLFLAPHLSSLASLHRWEDAAGECRCLTETGLEAWRMSRENYLEARELVREGESSYWVRTGGENDNQMVLGYMDTPLVRVSSWR